MTGSLAEAFFVLLGSSSQRGSAVLRFVCLWLVLDYVYTFDTWTIFAEHFNVNATFVDLLDLELSRWECRKCILVAIFKRAWIWVQFVAAISQSFQNFRTT